jgi:uncharacterized protein (DUF58 family)
MPAPTGRALLLALGGIVLAALPLLGAAALWPVWVLFVAALALLIGVDGILAPRERSVRLDLAVPQALYIGDAEDATLTVSTAVRRPLSLDLSVEVSADLERPARLRTTVRRGRPATLAVPLRPRRRGTVSVDHIHVRAPGPLGLMRRTFRRVEGQSLPVVPNLPRVRAVALKHFSSREFRTGLKIERYTGDGSEFEALREHLPGMDRRAIDWKASAKHHKLFSRQLRAERDHTVLFAVDTGRLMSEPIAGLPKLDHAIQSALLLSYFCLRTGDRVGIWGFDDRVRGRHDPVAGVQAMSGLSRCMAGLDYSTRETNFTVGLTDLCAHQRRRALVVVLTDFVDTVTAELMIDSLAHTASRHLVLFVALREPLLTATWSEPPVSTAALNRAVVAERLLRERQVVLRRLTRLGVRCIDAAPSEVSIQLIDRYLEIKRREEV